MKTRHRRAALNMSSVAQPAAQMWGMAREAREDGRSGHGQRQHAAGLRHHQVHHAQDRRGLAGQAAPRHARAGNGAIAVVPLYTLCVESVIHMHQRAKTYLRMRKGEDLSNEEIAEVFSCFALVPMTNEVAEWAPPRVDVPAEIVVDLPSVEVCSIGVPFGMPPFRVSLSR